LTSALGGTRYPSLRLTPDEVTCSLVTLALKASVGTLLHGASSSRNKKLHDNAFNASNDPQTAPNSRKNIFESNFNVLN
jgi:hypothetical protein